MLTPFGAATDAAQGSVQGSVRTSMRSPAALLRLIAWLAVLAAGVALLHGRRTGILEAPPHSPGAWSSWWTGSDPVVATMALLRLVVLGLGWYLLIATLLGLVAHLCRSAALWRLAELVTARSMRELVAGLVGVALVSATSAPASASPTLRSSEAATPIPIQLVLQAAEDQDGEVAVALDAGDVGATGDVGGETVPAEQIEPHHPTEEVALGEGEADPLEAGDLPRFRRRGGPLSGSDSPRSDVGEGTAADPPTDAGPDDEASGPVVGTEQSGTAGPEQRHRTGGRQVPEPANPVPLRDARPGEALDDAPSPTISSTLDEHIVEAGESFWVIASDVLAQAGEPIDERTVEPYWRVLIEANHDRLVVEGNPDLILPGQRLRVPPPASVTSPGAAP